MQCPALALLNTAMHSARSSSAAWSGSTRTAHAASACSCPTSRDRKPGSQAAGEAPGPDPAAAHSSHMACTWPSLVDTYKLSMVLNLCQMEEWEWEEEWEERAGV